LKGNVMSGGQIDRLCVDWLRENSGEETASEYRSDSLVIPVWTTPDLNAALERRRQALCVGFGSGESFDATCYREARRKLGLPDEAPIPEVFIRAFAETHERS